MFTTVIQRFAQRLLPIALVVTVVGGMALVAYFAADLVEYFVSSSGSIYFGSDALYAIDSSGTALWSSTSIVPVPHGIAAVSNGTVFDAASSGTASMIDGSGNIQWTARDLGSVAQVTAGPSGAVFVASSDGTVRALR